MNVNSWLSDARRSISGLDADLLMLTALGKQDRSELVLCGERILTDDEVEMLDKLLRLRRLHVPIAYLMGHKDFYGREFDVSLDVLIPRPETEAMIELVKKMDTTGKTIVDVGTGSGCVAITLAFETDAEAVIGVDNSTKALEMARRNAQKLGVEVKFLQSDLLAQVEESPDIVVANLPYVDWEWEWTSPEIDFEPKEALFAENGGLELIYRLIDQVKARDLILEADMSQHEKVLEYAKKRGYAFREKDGLALAFRREG